MPGSGYLVDLVFFFEFGGAAVAEGAVQPGAVVPRDAVHGVPRRVKPPRGVPIPSTAPCGQPAMCPGWSHGRTMRTTLAYEATSSSWSDGGARVDWGNREVIR